MDFTKAYLDNQDILSFPGCLYTFIDWRKLETSSSSFNLDGIHGRITSPEIARTRIITLEGVIDTMQTDKNINAYNYLQNIFALQNNLYEVEKKILKIVDIFGKSWEIEVKIKEPLEFETVDDDFTGTYYKWRVVLESSFSPIYFSDIENIAEAEEGGETGFTFPLYLESSFNQISNVLFCNNEGNFPSPAKFVITAKGKINKLKIKNLTNNTFFALDIQADKGDVIIIDSKTKTATKNGVNVLGNRVAGSIWQFIKKETIFTIYDEDNTNSIDFDIKIYWKDALL